ncbi:hypothetical protein KY290_003593 [Solanum tuberosum]|uniref:Uncharacterized protein n=1 Tax=Solanum tuberosum TaxID=4113 RepID=A0ABQ7WTV3_SOLTU|nr:hypothetical protein KY284_003744 [Solanum tuberosum]KAH0783995.1 hypothetical protein KY290_003593 [Solanum tuberosum]
MSSPRRRAVKNLEKYNGCGGRGVEKTMWVAKGLGLGWAEVEKMLGGWGNSGEDDLGGWGGVGMGGVEKTLVGMGGVEKTLVGLGGHRWARPI